MSEESRASPDLVELTRRAFVAANEGDFDALMSLFGPDPVFDVTPWGFGVYEGNRAIRRFLEDWIGSFDEYARGVSEVVDFGNGVIFTAALTRGRPAGRREQIQLPGASVFVWEAGMLVHVLNHREVDEARAAAERLAAERG